jgi:cytochrome c oxidase subunit 4
MSHDQHNHEEHEHLASYGTQVLVFFILLAMTGLMIGLTQLNISASIVNWTVITIATIKAAVIIAYLMHMKYEPKLFTILLVVALFTLAVVFGFTFFDYGFRSELFGQ